MRLKIHHATQYRFENPVGFGLQQIRKTPKSSSQQTIFAWKTDVQNGQKELSFEDHHNNTVELISFARNVSDVRVTSEGEVELTDTNGVIGAHRGPSPLWLYRRPTTLTRARAQVRSFLQPLSLTPDLEGLHALVDAIRGRVAYEVGASKPDWSAENALEAGRGVCQDQTHVFLTCARELGLPARYVSGYLMLDNTTVQDAMHAWAEAYVDPLGWVGFDVSNGISPDTRYVRVATGLDYFDASPITGVRIGGASEVLEVRIDVSQQ